MLPTVCHPSEVFDKNQCFLPHKRLLIGNSACRAKKQETDRERTIAKLCLSHNNYIIMPNMKDVVYKNIFCAMCVRLIRGNLIIQQKSRALALILLHKVILERGPWGEIFRKLLLKKGSLFMKWAVSPPSKFIFG